MAMPPWLQRDLEELQDVRGWPYWAQWPKVAMCIRLVPFMLVTSMLIIVATVAVMSFVAPQKEPTIRSHAADCFSDYIDALIAQGERNNKELAELPPTLSALQRYSERLRDEHRDDDGRPSNEDIAYAACLERVR